MYKIHQKLLHYKLTHIQVLGSSSVSQSMTFFFMNSDEDKILYVVQI